MFSLSYTTSNQPVDTQADKAFMLKVGTQCSRWFYPFRSVISKPQLETFAKELAKVALYEFRRFERIEDKTTWASINTKMRRCFYDTLSSSGFFTAVAADKARIVEKAVCLLAERGGGVSWIKLYRALEGAGEAEIRYLVKLSIELSYCELVLGISSQYRGESRHADLSLRLNGLSSRELQFLSLVNESGHNCEKARRLLGLSEFETVLMLKGLKQTILKSQGSD
ncbi:hypothetical protein [Vibrio mediterranei]|uniref:hypothetical protein n=1 Tax=Vibrio mediterranei TaxID=689 RepID=UPI004068B683